MALAGPALPIASNAASATWRNDLCDHLQDPRRMMCDLGAQLMSFPGELPHNL
jgi:hypothetical protein